MNGRIVVACCVFALASCALVQADLKQPDTQTQQATGSGQQEPAGRPPQPPSSVQPAPSPDQSQLRPRWWQDPIVWFTGGLLYCAFVQSRILRETLNANKAVERAYLAITPVRFLEWTNWPSVQPTAPIKIANTVTWPFQKFDVDTWMRFRNGEEGVKLWLLVKATYIDKFNNRHRAGIARVLDRFDQEAFTVEGTPYYNYDMPTESPRWLDRIRLAMRRG